MHISLCEQRSLCFRSMRHLVHCYKVFCHCTQCTECLAASQTHSLWIPCQSWTPPALPLYHWCCSQVFLEDSFCSFCWCGSGGWIEQWPPACSGAVCGREMVCPLHMSCCPQVVEFKATRGLERGRGSRGCGTVIACCGEKRFSGCSTFWPSPMDISCQWWSGQEGSRNLNKYNSCIKIL